MGPEQHISPYQGPQVGMCQDISVICNGKCVSMYS